MGPANLSLLSITLVCLTTFRCTQKLKGSGLICRTDCCWRASSQYAQGQTHPCDRMTIVVSSSQSLYECSRALHWFGCMGSKKALYLKHSMWSFFSIFFSVHQITNYHSSRRLHVHTYCEYDLRGCQRWITNYCSAVSWTKRNTIDRMSGGLTPKREPGGSSSTIANVCAVDNDAQIFPALHHRSPHSSAGQRVAVDEELCFLCSHAGRNAMPCIAIINKMR